MSSHRKDRKFASSNRQAAAYASRKKQHGFTGLDPSTMGLDIPDWLEESPPSASAEAQQLNGETSAGSEPQPRTVLEGMKVVCICKGIKKRVFWKALDDGAQSKEEINRRTGSGSGGCHGRRCGPRILEMLRNRSQE